MGKRLTQEEWEIKACQTHGDFYDYSKVKYVRGRDKVIIICPNHGEFLQLAKDHHYYGCKKCFRERRAILDRHSKEQWLQKAKETHGDKVFDYSLVPEDAMGEDYVEIICSEGHQWNVMFQSHCYRDGCPECYNQRRGETLRYTQEEWIAKAQEKFGYKYDYSKVNYNGSYDSITISCPDHGEFTTNPAWHLHSAAGCSKCADTDGGLVRRVTQEQFITNARTIHGDKYDYSKTQYELSRNYITITCPTHGDFEMQANEHTAAKRGCPYCSRSIIHPDDYIQDCIKVHGDTYDLSKVNYTGYFDYITPICPTHGLFRTRAGNFIRAGCGSCGSGGFKTTEPAYCYLLKYEFNDGVIRYKQGITNDVNRRMTSLKFGVNMVIPNTKVTLIEKKYFDLGQDAAELERHFLSLIDIRWTPDHKFDGSTEMYSEGILEHWEAEFQG